MTMGWNYFSSNFRRIMINEQKRSKRWELKITLKNEPERLGILIRDLGFFKFIVMFALKIYIIVVMTKLKSKKSFNKRFKSTSKNRLKRGNANTSHLFG